MKIFNLHRVIGLLCLCFIFSNVGAQDIALVGFTGDTGNDKFTFVALKNIPAGTTYYFTDDLYDPVTNTFDVSSVESLYEFVSPSSGLSIGDVIVVTEGTTANTIVETCESTVDCGTTMTLLDPSFSLSTTDELYCFSSSAPPGTSCSAPNVCNAIFNGMTEIHSSIRGSDVTTPLLPNSSIHPNAVNVIMPGQDGQFNVALRGNVLTTSDLSVATSYVTGDASSTVRFSQLNGATVSGAEIKLIGYDANGIAVIPSGSSNPSCMMNTQLQTQAINSGITNYIFTIQNIGSADLNLTGTPRVAISGSAALSIAQQPSSATIPSNTDLDFSIDFNPTTAGPHTATISIANDDNDEDPYTFVIGGEAVTTMPQPALAIVGMASTTPDQFSFVALRDIMPNEVFYFTDDTYDEETNTFEHGGNGSGIESLFKYEPTAIVKAGEVVVITEGSTSNQILVTCTDMCNNTDMALLDIPFSISTNEALYCFTSPAANTTAVDIFSNVDQIHSSMALASNVDYTDHSCFHPTALHVKLNSNDGQFNVGLRGNVLTTADLLVAANYVSGDASSTVPFAQLNGNTINNAEIQVIGYDASGFAIIPSGNSTPSCMLNTQLQTQEINSGPVYYSYTIQNIGSADLTLTGTPQVTISGSPAFSVAQQPPASTIPANTQLDFGIDFNPTTAGTHTTTITIANDDTDENPYTFVIEGEAVTTMPQPALAIVGMASSADAFSFVALRDIMPNEVFYFTDDTYDEETNAFEHGGNISGIESLFKYEPTATILAGEVVVITEGSIDDQILVTCTDMCDNADMTLINDPFSFGTTDALYCFTSPAANTTAVDIFSNVEQVHSSMALASNTDYDDHSCFHPTALHIKLNSNDGEFDITLRGTTLVTDFAALQDPNNYTAGAVSSTVEFDPAYCDAAGLQGTGSDYINSVQLNTINNTSGQTFYSDFTSISTALNIGSTYDLEVGLLYAFEPDTIYAWIDYNQDLVFDNATEAIDMGELIVGFDGSSIGNFTVPSGAVTGTTRMRVRSVFANVTGDPCSNEFGEVEDYSIEITDLALVNCGTPLNDFHCYSNNDMTSWSYAASDGSKHLRLEFTAGTIELGSDKVTIYDGADNTAPIIFDGDNGGDLAGLIIASTTPYIYMEVSSNATISCSSGDRTTWEWNVQCDNCPIATIDVANVPSCDQALNTYDIKVNISDLGLELDEYIIKNNVTSQEVSVTTTGIYTITNVPLGSTVDVTIESTYNPSCNITFPSIIQYCIPENDMCGDAISLAINPFGTCPSNQASGTSLGSTLDVTTSDCFGQDFPGVWYSFTTGPNQTAVNFSFENINNSYHGFTIYDDCLGTSIIYCNQADVNDYVPNLLPETTYFILVIHGGAPGEFNICLSDPEFCPDYQDLVGEIPGTGIYSSANDLGNIDPNGQIISTQTIKGTANVDYSAGREILLEPGFIVEGGALFHAYIDGCISAPTTLQSDNASNRMTYSSQTDQTIVFNNSKKLEAVDKQKAMSPFLKKEKVKEKPIERKVPKD